MSSSDPRDPDYLPTYTGAPGNYGKGDEFGIDLYAVYHAGVLKIPTTAGHYSSAVTQLHAIIGMMDGIAGELDHVAGWGMKSQTEAVCDAMRVTTSRMYDAGDALVEIVDTYAATDQAARDEFATLLEDPTNAGMFEQIPPRVDPPAETDPPDPSVLPVPPEESEEALDDILEDAGIDDPREDDEDDDNDEEGDD